jgi:hypothetical protein
MGIIFASFLRAALWFASGVGLTSLVDKFVPDKLPTGTAPLTNITDATGRINWMKVGLIVLIGAVGIMLLRFVGKKLNVKILK